MLATIEQGRQALTANTDNVRSRISVLLLAAAMIASLVPVAGARPQSPRLLIQGQANAYRDIRLSKALRIRCCGYASDDGKGGLEITGFDVAVGGIYGGFVIERLRDGRVMLGAIRVPSMDLGDGDVPFFAPIGHDRKLAAGAYRVHLIGDDTTRVMVDIAGTTGDVHVQTNRSSDVTARMLVFDEQVAHESQRLELELRSAAIVAIQSDVEAGQLTYLSACITDADECVGEEEEDRAEDLHVSPGSGRSGTTVSTYYNRGELTADEAFARFTVGTLGASTKAHGFYLILN